MNMDKPRLLMSTGNYSFRDSAAGGTRPTTQLHKVPRLRIVYVYVHSHCKPL